MKNLEINIPKQELRMYNETSQNWEVKTFKELELQENENFATQIEEIQHRFNNAKIGTKIQIEYFGILDFELFEDTIQVKGVEKFNPETKDVFLESKNGRFIYLGKSNSWDTTGLSLEDITVPKVDGVGFVLGYKYNLELGDTDIYDVLNYTRRWTA